MSTGRPGFRVSLFGVRLAVVADSAAIAEAMHHYVLPWLPRAPLDDSPADRLVEVRRAAHGSGLEILVDGQPCGEAPDPVAAVPPVQRALDEALVRFQSEVAVVHGGVVGHEGRAIILPGPTRSGKSTLVAELVRRGASYLSDEYALVGADGRIHPYPRPLLLRDASGEDRPPRLATELGGTVAREPMRAGLVIGMRREPDAVPTLRATSQAEGVFLLLCNTPQALVDQPWILAPLTRAVAGASCYAGLRGEAEETADTIFGLDSSVTVAAPGRHPSGSGRPTSPGAIGSA